MYGPNPSPIANIAIVAPNRVSNANAQLGIPAKNDFLLSVFIVQIIQIKPDESYTNKEPKSNKLINGTSKIVRYGFLIC